VESCWISLSRDIRKTSFFYLSFLLRITFSKSVSPILIRHNFQLRKLTFSFCASPWNVINKGTKWVVNINQEWLDVTGGVMCPQCPVCGIVRGSSTTERERERERVKYTSGKRRWNDRETMNHHRIAMGLNCLTFSLQFLNNFIYRHYLFKKKFTKFRQWK